MLVKCAKCSSIVPRTIIESHLREELGYAPIVCLLCLFRPRFFDEATAQVHVEARHGGIPPSFAEKTDQEMEKKVKELIAKCKDVSESESYGSVNTKESNMTSDPKLANSSSLPPFKSSQNSKRENSEAKRKQVNPAREESLTTTQSNKRGNGSTNPDSIPSKVRKSVCSTPKSANETAHTARFAFDQSTDTSTLISEQSTLYPEPILPNLEISSLSHSMDNQDDKMAHDYGNDDTVEDDVKDEKEDNKTDKEPTVDKLPQDELYKGDDGDGDHDDDHGDPVYELPEPLDEEEAVLLPKAPVLPKGHHECLRCHRSFRELGDHVSTQHFGRPMFKCKLCPFVSTRYMHDHPQRAHVKSRHQKLEHWMLYFTDLRADVMAELAACFESCFPTQQLPSPPPYKVPENLVSSGDSTIFIPTGVPLTTCEECNLTIPETERKNHAMQCHMDGEKAFQCRLCSHSSPFWTGQFHQLAKHVECYHPGQGHWKKVVVDKRKNLGPIMAALETRLYKPKPVQSKSIVDDYSEERQNSFEIPEKKILLNIEKEDTDLELEVTEVAKAEKNPCKLCGKCNNTVDPKWFQKHVIVHHLPQKVENAAFCKVCAKVFLWCKDLRNMKAIAAHAASHNKSVQVSLKCEEYAQLRWKDKLAYRRSRELLARLTTVESIESLPKVLLTKPPEPELSMNRRAVASRARSQCPECGEMVTVLLTKPPEPELSMNRRAVASRARSQCPECGEMVTVLLTKPPEPELSMNRRAVASRARSQCPECGEMVTVLLTKPPEPELSMNRRAVASRARSQCPECGEMVTVLLTKPPEPELSMNRRAVASRARSQCPECGEMVTVLLTKPPEPELSMNRRAVASRARSQCPECGEMVTVLLTKPPEPELSMNRRAVASRARSQCPECGEMIKIQHRKFHAWEHWDDKEGIIIRCRLCDWRPGGIISERCRLVHNVHLPRMHGLPKLTLEEAEQKGWIENQLANHIGIKALSYRLFPSTRIIVDRRRPSQYFAELTLAGLKERAEAEGIEPPSERSVRDQCLKIWRRMGKQDREKYRKLLEKEQENCEEEP